MNNRYYNPQPCLILSTFPPCSLLLVVATLLLCSSCATYSVFQHPMHNNTHVYRAMPLQSDSLSTSYYVAGTVFHGGANDISQDDIWGLHGQIHAAHNLKNVQFLYGINGSLGVYDIGSRYEGYYSVYPNYQKLNEITGSRFFGSVGAVAAANLVFPIGTYGEWRVIGLEYNFQHEWDNNYQQFRNTLLDEDVNGIDRSRNYATLGLTTDMIGRLTAKMTCGIKMELGRALNTIEFTKDGVDRQKIHRSYLSAALHVGDPDFTGFVQYVKGYYIRSFQVGVNIRLHRKKERRQS